MPMWDYYWGLSERQVDLLLVDQAIVVYEKSKDKKPKAGDKKKGVREMAAPSRLAVAEAEAKWRARYGNGQKPKLNLNFGAVAKKDGDNGKKD